MDKPDSLLPLVIVGMGGHGREFRDIVEAVNNVQPKYDVLGFLDDEDRTNAGRKQHRLGPVVDLKRIEAQYVIGVGSPESRRSIAEVAAEAGRTAALLVHPSATVGSEVELGAGCVLAAGSRITTHVRMGVHVHLNVNATVSHDCTLGDYVSLSPGVHLSGNVTVGSGVFFGTGAIVIPGCTIGSDAVIGAGAAVVRDVAPGEKVVGVPARAMRGKGGLPRIT